jgi:predicted Rossmann fold flavoprotein
MKKTEILIIGGGASGMMAAIAAARRGAAVRILEKGDRLGRKLLATGNGRCNYTNSTCTDKDFSCSDETFPLKAYEIFDASQTISFFETLGILPRVEAEGRVYPYSEQASAMLEALVAEMNKLGVEILLNCNVKGIKIDGTSFIVQLDGGKQYKGDKVIVATGGKAGAQ